MTFFSNCVQTFTPKLFIWFAFVPQLLSLIRRNSHMQWFLQHKLHDSLAFSIIQNMPQLMLSLACVNSSAKWAVLEHWWNSFFIWIALPVATGNTTGVGCKRVASFANLLKELWWIIDITVWFDSKTTFILWYCCCYHIRSDCDKPSSSS